MPKNSDTYEEYEQDYGKNAPYRSSRRDARRPKGRGRERRISVRSVQREQADARKLARAVIRLAMARAEAEATATDSEGRSEVSDES